MNTNTKESSAVPAFQQYMQAQEKEYEKDRILEEYYPGFPTKL
jgi:hypothetical protein